MRTSSFHAQSSNLGAKRAHDADIFWLEETFLDERACVVKRDVCLAHVGPAAAIALDLVGASVVDKEDGQLATSEARPWEKRVYIFSCGF